MYPNKTDLSLVSPGTADTLATPAISNPSAGKRLSSGNY